MAFSRHRAEDCPWPDPNLSRSGAVLSYHLVPSRPATLVLAKRVASAGRQILEAGAFLVLGQGGCLVGAVDVGGLYQ